MNLPSGQWFLMRPCLRGMYRMESLLDGTLRLKDVALANDVLDMAEENERRWHAEQERERQRNTR